MEPEPEPELAAAVAVLTSAEGGATAARTLTTLIKNLIEAPDNPKFRRVRVSNPKIRSSLLDVPGGEAFLLVLGFAPSAATDEHAAGTFLEISATAAKAVQEETGAAALAALQRVERVEQVTKAQPSGPTTDTAPGVEFLSKNHPTVVVSCAAEPRNGLSLEEAVAWCRSLPDCTGMWYYENGRCCPKVSWDEGTFTKVIPGGAFYRVGPEGPEAAASDMLRLLLGEKLLGLGRGTVGIDALGTRDVVALYFSAHWCPPCRGFTPQLALYYGAMWGRRPGALEVVFVSRDRDQASFQEYSDKMPWLSMPFSEDDGRRDGLASHFGVRGIPALIFINPVTCEVLLEDGRSHVLGDPHALQFPWPTGVVDSAALSSSTRLADAVADAAQILLPRAVTPAETAARQEMMGRISSHAESVLQYEDPMSQAIAMSHIPLEELDANAAVAPSAPWGARHNSRFFRELLRWFKADFFKWTDAPACGFCGGKTESAGMGQPSPQEAADHASRVEIYTCQACGSMTRFPRYNKATKLLETRNGRCGEWANCFTLLCRSLGFPARLVMDWTDHVWTEVYLAAEPSQGLEAGWKHCDPCENRFDAPLLYESGWGKKLSYVVGFSCCEIVDVSARYTNHWSELLKRRAQIQEFWLDEAIHSMDVRQRSRGLGGEAAAVIEARKAAEVRELRARQAVAIRGDRGAKPEERVGRQTGSLEWRAQRGETGTDNAVRVCSLVQSSAGSVATLYFTPEHGEEAHGVGEVSADTPTGNIIGDSPEVALGDTAVLDLRADSSFVELEKPTFERICPAEHCGRSFTVEVWLACEDRALSSELHNNPVISRHGVASGFELRLGAHGEACFLLTVDGDHIEVSGKPSTSGGTPGGCGSGGGGGSNHPPLRHLAGVYNAEERLLQVWSGMECVGQAVVPTGVMSVFDGPLNLGALDSQSRFSVDYACSRFLVALPCSTQPAVDGATLPVLSRRGAIFAAGTRACGVSQASRLPAID